MISNKPMKINDNRWQYNRLQMISNKSMIIDDNLTDYKWFLI